MVKESDPTLSFGEIPLLKECPIHPVSNWVVVREMEKKTKEGLLLPNQVKEKSSYIGVVLARGPDSDFQQGDVVFFQEFGRISHSFQGESWTMVRDNDIQGILATFRQEKWESNND